LKIKSQTCREAGTESHGSQDIKTAGLPLKQVARRLYFQPGLHARPNHER